MPSFRKRGDKWEYRIQYYDTTGKRREKAKGGFRTKADAKLAADYASVDVQEGHVSSIDKKMTISKYLDIWFELYKPTVKLSSHRNRATIITMIKKKFGDTLLNNLTNSAYQKQLNELSLKYSKNTLTGIHVVMKMMMKQAISDGYFKSDILQGVKIPKGIETDTKINYWQNEDIVNFHKYHEKQINSLSHQASIKHNSYLVYQTQRDYVMLMTCLYTGLRIGETCVLQMDDVDLNNRTINVNKTYVLGERFRDVDFQLGTPKTKAAYRSVPIPDILYVEMVKMLKLQKEYKMMFRNVFADRDFIFTNTRGLPFPPQSVGKKLKTIIKNADLPLITTHGLRHTHTSILIQSGVHVKEAQERLGHSSFSTTMGIYGHIDKEVIIESTKKMNDFIDRIVPK